MFWKPVHLQVLTLTSGILDRELVCQLQFGFGISYLETALNVFGSLYPFRVTIPRDICMASCVQ